MAEDSFPDAETAIRHEAADWYGAPIEWFRAIANYHGSAAFAVALGDRPLAPEGWPGHVEEVALEEGVCRQTPDGRWELWISGSGGGSGWKSLDEGRELGVVSYTDVAAEGASAVVVEWRGRRHTVPVRDGLILFTSWDEPSDCFGGDAALEAALDARFEAIADQSRASIKRTTARTRSSRSCASGSRAAARFRRSSR